MTFHDSLTDIPDPEVVPKAKRRQFSAQYKVRILEEGDGYAAHPAHDHRKAD